jgi:hypothetical protein
MDCRQLDDALALIRMEYLEMPDLRLTHRQAARLWNLSPELCELSLRTLVQSGFLVRTPSGSFVRRRTASERTTELLRAM